MRTITALMIRANAIGEGINTIVDGWDHYTSEEIHQHLWHLQTLSAEIRDTLLSAIQDGRVPDRLRTTLEQELNIKVT